MSVSENKAINLCENKPCQKGFGQCPHFSHLNKYLKPDFVPKTCLIEFYANLDIEKHLECHDCDAKSECDVSRNRKENAIICLDFNRYTDVKNIAKKIVAENQK